MHRYIYLILILLLCGCKGKGQEKINSSLEKNKNVKTDDSISSNFNNIYEYYFDTEKNIPYGIFIDKNIGRFEINYTPIDEKIKNFLKISLIRIT